MMIIGLTGGIGSGKSFIAALFKKLNIPVYNSDERAKELMVSDQKIVTQLQAKFGDSVIKNNQLDKKQIAAEIFQNKELLKWIESIVHPAVQKDFERWCFENKDVPFVLKEAAILIESGAYKQCDKIIVVTAPKEIRIERVMQRDGLNRQQVEARMQHQMAQEELTKHSHFIIVNDGVLDVEPKVELIYNQLAK